MNYSHDQNTLVNNLYSLMLNKITSGEWPVGQRIPTEKTLAKQFHVSRTSVRQALSQIKALGILESRQGSGTYVTKASETSALVDIISSVMYDIHDQLQVFEFHKGLQIECAKLACMRYTDKQLDTLISLVAKMKSSSFEKDTNKAIFYDLEFHKVVCEMSGNIMFVRATTLIYQHLKNSFQLIGSSFDYDESIIFHERFIQALKERNAIFAASVMEAHQWDTYQKFLKIHLQNNL